MSRSDTGTQKEFFARCAGGFERTLASELKALGCQRVRALVGGVAFFGETEDGLRACLWSRVATRVQLVLARVSAHDAETLYAGVRKFPWEKRIAPGASICMQAHGENAQLRNTQFTALKVKDAVCDRLVAERGARPDVDSKDPDFAVDISIHRDKATLYLNLSGPALHRRGYRAAGVQTQAPLKETLAAGILLEAGWGKLAHKPATFADPMCGSGTLAIEAALIAMNAAPGLLRSRWGFESWLQHEPAVWERLVADARERMLAPDEVTVRILAGDMDASAVEIARANMQRAGVADVVELFVDDAAELGRHLQRGRTHSSGLLVCNPPYGYRLGSGEDLPATYAALDAALGSLESAWTFAAITPDAGIDTGLGRRPQVVLPCRNGALATSLRIYELASSPRSTLEVTALSGENATVRVAEKTSEQFAARLRKVAKERAKWARKAGVTSYRIYDADLPDYAFSVDLFCVRDDGADEHTCARVEEHRAGSEVDPERANRRFFDGIALVSAVLGIPRRDVFFKRATQSKGAPASAAHWANVREGDFVFEADLGSQRTSGLALDMRAGREMLREMAADKRFVCLLAHGGAPTTYAAAGGAVSTTTVDSTEIFLEQAQRVVRANGFAEGQHAFVASDPLEWLSREASGGQAYDLIYCDLNAFPVCDGHSAVDAPMELLEAIEPVLAADGRIMLVCSTRGFRLPDEAFGGHGFVASDVTAQTIGHDFSRTPKIHRCFIISREP